jgi:hypothetical protein
MTTQLDLEAIKARADAATPGPWFTEYGYKTVKVMTKTPKGHGRIMLAQDWIPRQHVDGPLQDDAEFIAHARTYIPMLVAEVESLQLRLRTLAQYATHLDDCTRDYVRDKRGQPIGISPCTCGLAAFSELFEEAK